MSLIDDFLKLCHNNEATARYLEIISGDYQTDTYCEVHHKWSTALWTKGKEEFEKWKIL